MPPNTRSDYLVTYPVELCRVKSVEWSHRVGCCDHCLRCQTELSRECHEDKNSSLSQPNPHITSPQPPPHPTPFTVHSHPSPSRNTHNSTQAVSKFPRYYRMKATLYCGNAAFSLNFFPITAVITAVIVTVSLSTEPSVGRPPDCSWMRPRNSDRTRYDKLWQLICGDTEPEVIRGWRYDLSWLCDNDNHDGDNK